MRRLEPSPGKSKLDSWHYKLSSLACLAMMIALVGCGNQLVDPSQRYVDSWRQYSGQNGLGLHRRMWEQAGSRCVVPQRLSGRLQKVDVIVLVANTMEPPGKLAREWMEQWLRQTPGRTVVYFGRDFDAREYYFQRTRRTASPAEQAKIDDHIAQIHARELQKLVGSFSQSAFCDWWYVDVDERPQEIDGFAGPWSDAVVGAGRPQPEPSEATATGDTNSLPHLDDPSWPVRSLLLPPDLRFKEPLPSWLSAKPAANPVKPITQTPPTDPVENLIQRSVWDEESEFDTTEAWNEAFDTLLASEVLLESSDGIPLVYRLTHDERLGDGQILVAVNGAPFLNASLVQPHMFEIGKRITQECLPADRVALLAYDADGMQLSSIDEADVSGTGLEMFLIWPLAPIVILGILLLIVVGLRYLPPLGRGQDLPQETTSNFGLHAEAIGNLLRQTGDDDYARRTIANYFRTVRNEPPPSWTEQAE